MPARARIASASFQANAAAETLSILKPAKTQHVRTGAHNVCGAGIGMVVENDGHLGQPI
jgi:hypothetical protein